MRHRFSSFSVMTVLLIASGCMGEITPPSVIFFHAGNYPAALADQEDRMAKPNGIEPRNSVLEKLRLGMLVFEMGDSTRADMVFKDAIEEIGDFGRVVGENSALSLFGAESSVSFKGHPYERMAALMFYGINRYLMGTIEDRKTAFAAFQNSIAEDYAYELEAEAQKDENAKKELAGDPTMFQCDSVFAYYMSAQARIQIGDPADKVKEDLATARRLAMKRNMAVGVVSDYFNPDTCKDSNLLVVVGMKREPRKVGEGQYREICKIYPGFETPEVSCRVFVDGKPAGDAQLMEDFYFQASTRGGREMDSILKGKASFKSTTDAIGTTLAAAGALAMLSDNRDIATGGAVAAGIGLALMIFSAVMNPSADVRHVEMLPGQLHVLQVKAPAGKRTLALEFRDANGAAIPTLAQIWKNLDVPEKGQAMYYFRACTAKAGDHDTYQLVWPVVLPGQTPLPTEDGTGVSDSSQKEEGMVAKKKRAKR